MAFVDGSVVNVALPAIQRDLDATAAQMQWVVEAYALFLASCCWLVARSAIGSAARACSCVAWRCSPLPPWGVHSRQRPRC